MVKNELLKKPDTRSVQHEPQVQSGCEAKRYPRLGTGGGKKIDKLAIICYSLKVNMEGLYEPLTFYCCRSIEKILSVRKENLSR